MGLLKRAKSALAAQRKANMSTIIDFKKEKWTGVVGLEVHAQIQSKSKLFSGAGTEFGEFVNNQVSFFDAAIPGTLPVLNKECVKAGITTALALNCDISPISWFDRKHYFYADLPAGYQITQQRAPFARNGHLEFQVIPEKGSPYTVTSKIKQIQLEQDSGKSLHDALKDASLVDLNRAGNPLMELVFEPDLKSGEEAASLVKELLLILKALGTCSCKMEEGALRVDANISLKRENSRDMGTRTEVKNIGSVRGVFKAVDFEIERQKRAKRAGKEIVNETRSWDAVNNRTLPMRDKEEKQDYRFMPEPNLPPLRISLEEEEDGKGEISVPTLRKEIPKLPAYFRQQLARDYDITLMMAVRLLNEPVLLRHFLAIAKGGRNIKKVADILTTDFAGILNRENIAKEECKAKSEHIAEAVDLLENRIINRVIFAKILTEIAKCDEISPKQIVERNEWHQITDPICVANLCAAAMEGNAETVTSYRKAKKNQKGKYAQLILNSTIKLSGDKIDISAASNVLQKLLDSDN